MRQNAFVYVMAHEGLVKVGHSQHPIARAKSLGLDPSSIAFVKYEAQAERVEREAHAILKLAGHHVRLEWFSCSIEVARAALDRAACREDAAGELPGLPGDIVATLDERIAARFFDFTRIEFLRGIVNEWATEDRKLEMAAARGEPYISDDINKMMYRKAKRDPNNWLDDEIPF